MILLNKNENQYGPAPECFEIMKEMKIDVMNSYPRYEVSILKDELSKYFDIQKDRIILSYGAEDLLRQLYYHFLMKNDTVLMSEKSWYYYRNLSNYVGANLQFYPNMINEHKYYVDIERILTSEKLYKSKMLVICSPDNPTGNGISYDELEAILENKKDGIVLFDEAYWGFSDSNNQMMSKLINKYKNLIILRTFSKYFALAGLRVGFAFCGDYIKELINHNERLLGFNRVSEQICISALKAKDYYSDINKKIFEDRNLLISEINKLDGYKAYSSKANFFLADIPDKNRENLKKSLEKNEIVIKFLNEPGFQKSARITVGTREQNHLLLSAFKESITI